MTRIRVFSPCPPPGKSPRGARAPKAPAEAAAKNRRRLRGQAAQTVDSCCLFNGLLSFLSVDSGRPSFVLMLIQARSGCQELAAKRGRPRRPFPEIDRGRKMPL